MIVQNREPNVRLLENGNVLLLEPVEYIYAGCRITVPDGFICDGASVPRFFWRVCGGPRDQKNLLAGILHDYLYSTHLFDRELADKIFYETLLEVEKTPWIAWGMWKAVRVGGASRY